MRKKWLLGTILLGCLVFAVACGGDPAAPEPTPGPTATPFPTEDPFDLDDIIWTSGVEEATGRPLDEVESYTTVSPAIVAVVPAEHVPSGTEFTATWSIDGLDVPEATISVTVEQDMSTAWVAFEFVRDEGRYFPLGTLEVTVTTSTGEAIVGSVNIQLP